MSTEFVEEKSAFLLLELVNVKLGEFFRLAEGSMVVRERLC